MTVHELRDLDLARRFIVQGLWLIRALPAPAKNQVKAYLEWALEIASSGEPLPPIGFIADVGVAAFAMDRGEKGQPRDATNQPTLPPVLARTYEDHVLGKLYGDWTFERAADALKTYVDRKDRIRGLAFLVARIRKRTRFGGVLLSPSVIRLLVDASPDETLRAGRESIETHGLMPLLIDLYQGMVDAARRTGEVLTEGDIRALENRIALADPSQQLAHDQIMQVSRVLRTRVSDQKVKPLPNREEVPTRVMDEDSYPVGGFTSISTRGSVESLLHSQLAYMERDARPDLFDIKYLRDELYYYSRDENQFLRRRRSFVFLLFADLIQARFQDPDLPDRELRYQRIILTLGLVHAAIERLVQWLGGDALHFDFVFVSDGGPTPLDLEYQLLEMVFLEQIENETISIHPVRAGKTETSIDSAMSSVSQDALQTMTIDQAAGLCRDRARKSMCHVLALAMRDRRLEIDEAVVTRLTLDVPKPGLAHGSETEVAVQDDWPDALQRLLQLWV